MKNRIRTEIEDRIQFLQEIIRKKTASLKKAPEGTLRISPSGRGVQYYRRMKGRSDGGKYIRRSDVDLVRRLAQKDYDEKVKSAAEEELKLLFEIQKIYRGLDDKRIEEVFFMLSAHRQNLVQPIALTDEEFVKRWQEQEYARKPFSDDYPEYYTNRGERVRSKSEIIIANLLDKLGIPYHYEKPVELDGYGTIYPDFTILRTDDRKELFLEHLGMMDDPEYCRHALERVALYEKNGFFIGDMLLISYETSLQPLNVRLLEKMLRLRCPDESFAPGRRSQVVGTIADDKHFL